MPWLSSSRPSTSSRLESTTTAPLGGTQISLTLLEKMTDGVPVPFVKAAAGIAVEVIKMTQLIQAKREECDNLMKRCTSLLVVILVSLNLKGKTEQDIPSDLRDRVEALTGHLVNILSKLKIIDSRAGEGSSRSKMKVGLCHCDNTRKLTGCAAKSDWAMQEFQVMSKVDSCLKDLERHEELKKELKEGREELRNDLRADIQEGLSTLSKIRTWRKSQLAYHPLQCLRAQDLRSEGIYCHGHPSHSHQRVSPSSHSRSRRNGKDVRCSLHGTRCSGCQSVWQKHYLGTIRASHVCQHIDRAAWQEHPSNFFLIQ
ncbi:hypothetical protein FRC02_001689 [Tulasnella sp. 418]|nr:hypothetical protein FRC02_001689 [Tulasnella sp. 418]